MYNRIVLSKQSLKSDDVHLWRLINPQDKLDQIVPKILSFYAPLAPDEFVIKENTNGKPYLDNVNNLHFNLSHSGLLACLAISSIPVGVDIERIDLNRDFMRTAERIMSTKQFEILNAITDRDTQAIFFFQYWTFFEALVKGLGETQFSDHPTIKNLFLSNPYSAFTQAAEWTILRVNFQGGFSTAVATTLDNPQISIMDYFSLA